MKNTQTILVVGDFHVPYQDAKAVAAVLRVIPKLAPTSIHLLGDVVDFYAVSSHLKDPDRLLTLQTELDETAELIREIRRRAGDVPIIYHEGNHEDRLKRYLKRQAAELSNLRSLSMPSLLGLNDLRITYLTNNRPFCVMSKLLLTHGTLVRSQSAYTARGILAKYGKSVIQGHCHRLGAHYKTLYDTQLCAFENGCLCELTPNASNTYTKGIPDWQHGFSIVHCWSAPARSRRSAQVAKPSRRRFFDVEQVRIQDGQIRPSLLTRGC